MSRRDWMDDVQRKQRNIAPEDVIRNDAIVEGSLIRGDTRLSRVQRIGAIILGIFYSSLGIIIIWSAVGGLFEKVSHDAYVRPVVIPLTFLIGCGFSYMGFRMIWNGLFGSWQQRRKRNR